MEYVNAFLFAAIVFVYLITGTMNIGEIINYQSIHGPLVFSIPLAALMFFMLIITKSPYSPFAITKDKALVSGFETEHFGFLRGFMLFSESIAWYVMLWVFLTIFFGSLNAVGYLIGMIVISVITGFINACNDSNYYWSILLLWNYINDIYRGSCMNSENIIVYFVALVAIGIIVVGLLTSFLHSALIVPIVIIGFVLTIFVLLSKGNFSHKIESIEKICFIITFLAIICSFILLYKPL